MPMILMMNLTYIKAVLIGALLAALILLSGCTLRPKMDSVNHKLSHNIIELSSPRVTVTHIHSGWVSVSTSLKTGNGLMIYKGENIFGKGKTEIVIKDETLIVDSKNYGRLNYGDAIIVDHEKVFVNAKQVEQIASK